MKQHQATHHRRGLMPRRLFSALLVAALTVSLAACADDATTALLDRMVQHKQGWGVLGINERAYDPAAGSAPMDIGGQRFESGLGSHAPQESTFVLDGGFLRFEAEVGVQTQAQGLGSVVFQVYVDDTLAFDSGIVRENEPARPVRVDVAGAESLRLVATDAGDGIGFDCANWANARLIPDPEAAARAPEDGLHIDVAPFARMVTFDPARMHGTKRTRLDAWNAEDLFLETELFADANQAYTLPSSGNGEACVGLQWLERRL